MSDETRAAEPSAPDETAPAPPHVPEETPDETAPVPASEETPQEISAPEEATVVVPVAGSPAVAEPQGPATPLSVEPAADADSSPKRKRRFPWRWVAAVVLAGGVGAGCAFAVMAPQRTDIPGLRTASDGRYQFAPLTLPSLAPGQSGPIVSGNTGNQHLSDIRKLLLSAPQGATPDASLPGQGGWLTLADTIKVAGGGIAAQQFATDGLRHTAAVGWKTPDGASTKIYLLQFIDSSAANDAGAAFSDFGTSGNAASGSNSASSPQSFNASTGDVVLYSILLNPGDTQTYFGQVQSGDVQFLISFTEPRSVGIAPFEQELDLQLEMLD